MSVSVRFLGCNLRQDTGSALIDDQRIVRIHVRAMDIASQHVAGVVVLANQRIAVIGEALRAKRAAGDLIEPPGGIVFESSLERDGWPATARFGSNLAINQL